MTISRTMEDAKFIAGMMAVIFILIMLFFAGFMVGWHMKDSQDKANECYGKYLNARLSDIPFDCLQYIKTN